MNNYSVHKEILKYEQVQFMPIIYHKSNQIKPDSFCFLISVLIPDFLNIDFNNHDFEFGPGMVWCYLKKTKSSHKTSENSGISIVSLGKKYRTFWLCCC